MRAPERMGHAQTASVSAYVHDVQREVHQFFAIVSPLPRVVYNLRRELAQYASHVEGVTGDNGLSSSAASVGGAAIDTCVAPHTPHLPPKQAPTSKQASIPKQAGAWDVDRRQPEVRQPEVRWGNEVQGMPVPGDGLDFGRSRSREEEIGRVRSRQEEILADRADLRVLSRSSPYADSEPRSEPRVNKRDTRESRSSVEPRLPACSAAANADEIDSLFRDLEDRLETEASRLKMLTKWADELETELRQAIDLQTNRVLSTLTVLTAVFVPGNFLAAVWGMNFRNMPELEWENGYTIFWTIVVVNWVLFFVWYRTCLKRG